MQVCTVRQSIITPDVTVIGDLILDRYWHGTVTRNNPEAPGVVVNVATSTSTLGGAGAVASLLDGLGLAVSSFGMVGDDDFGQELTGLLDEVCRGGRITALTSGCTTAKHRIVANGTLLHNRFDFEEISQAGELETEWCEALPFGKVVIVSDYGKGVCSDAILHLIAAKSSDEQCYVIVDPARGRYLGDYVGCDLIKMNATEAHDLVAQPPSSAAMILSDLNHCAVVVTDGSDGMYYADADQHFHVPARPVRLVDQTGAGDTVAAAIAYGRVKGMDMRSTLELAAELAAQQVGQVGVSQVEVPRENRL